MAWSAVDLMFTMGTLLRRRILLVCLSAPLARDAFSGSAYGSTTFPDFVAMLHVDRLFQASGALHNNHVAYYGAAELSAHPDDKLGYATLLALSINNIPTGARVRTR